MIELRQAVGGVLVPVKARPGAKRDAIVGEHDGRLKVEVGAAAEKGKANEAIVKLLAREFGLRKADVALQQGRCSSKKLFRIEGVDLATMRSHLEASLARIHRS